MPLFNFEIDDKTKEDFKVCSDIDDRSMGAQLRVLMLAEIKNKAKDHPEKFKEKK